MFHTFILDYICIYIYTCNKKIYKALWNHCVALYMIHLSKTNNSIWIMWCAQRSFTYDAFSWNKKKSYASYAPKVFFFYYYSLRIRKQQKYYLIFFLTQAKATEIKIWIYVSWKHDRGGTNDMTNIFDKLRCNMRHGYFVLSRESLTCLDSYVISSHETLIFP